MLSYHTKNWAPNVGEATPFHRNQRQAVEWMCTRPIYCDDDGHQTQGLMPAASTCNETVRKKGDTFFKTTFNEQASSPGQFKSKTSKDFHLSPKSSASETDANSRSLGTMITRTLLHSSQVTLQAPPLLPRPLLICTPHSPEPLHLQPTIHGH